MAPKVRYPAVAGRFYPRDPDDLRADVDSFLSPPKKTVAALGCIVPHAGYMYSGPVAGAVYAGLDLPQRCILMCPNHTGVGQPLAIMSQGAWETPLGQVPIDFSLADRSEATVSTPGRGRRCPPRRTCRRGAAALFAGPAA